MNEREAMIQAMNERDAMLEQSKPVICSNCGNNTFNQVYLMRRVSAVLSPAGIESLLPAPVFECSACGATLVETIHPAIMVADKELNSEKEEVKDNVRQLIIPNE